MPFERDYLEAMRLQIQMQFYRKPFVYGHAHLIIINLDKAIAPIIYLFIWFILFLRIPIRAMLTSSDQRLHNNGRLNVILSLKKEKAFKCHIIY